MTKSKFAALLKQAFTNQMTALEIPPARQKSYVREWAPIIWETIPLATRKTGTVLDVFAYVPPLSLCLLLVSFPKAMTEHLAAVQAEVSSAL